MEVRTGYSLWVLQYKPSATVMIVAIALESLIYQVFFVCSRASSTRASRRRVAILYSSSQNSLMPEHKKHIVSLKEEVAILYSSSQNSLVKKIHFNKRRNIYSKSQSFIHQVRILSTTQRRPSTLQARGRNPLFIKSEFSPDEDYYTLHQEEDGRNPLFIKSEFSRGIKELMLLYLKKGYGWCRNPLFIKSEFSRGIGYKANCRRYTL